MRQSSDPLAAWGVLTLVVLTLLVVLNLVVVSPCRATTLAAWSLEDFVYNSNAAVTGTVTSIDVRWNDDHTQIHTYVTLDIDQLVMGEALPDELVLDQIGGRVGRIMAEIPGSPVYHPGEQVFVFVERVDDVYRTLGFYQGKYTLETDPLTQREFFVQRAPAGVSVAVEEGLERPPSAVAYGRQELIDRVREIAGAN